VTVYSNFTALTIDEEHLILKYRAVIQEIGPMVDEFVPHGLLIFFGNTAPPELREVSVIHDGTHLTSSLVVGDLLKFVPPSSNTDEGAQTFWYRLTAVGEVASKNLADLGHVVVHFDAATKAKLPGTISVEPSLELLPPVGTIIAIFGQEVE
jgi:PTS system glucitol/sorbitol-specific IIA component